jgi:hypothetical protein
MAPSHRPPPPPHRPKILDQLNPSKVAVIAPRDAPPNSAKPTLLPIPPTPTTPPPYPSRPSKTPRPTERGLQSTAPRPLTPSSSLSPPRSDDFQPSRSPALKFHLQAVPPSSVSDVRPLTRLGLPSHPLSLEPSANPRPILFHPSRIRIPRPIRSSFFLPPIFLPVLPTSPSAPPLPPRLCVPATSPRPVDTNAPPSAATNPSPPPHTTPNTAHPSHSSPAT